LWDWLSAGPVGLVSGAFVGLVFGVLFEDPLKRLIRAIGRLLRRLTSGPPETPDLGREFRLGPLHAPCLIIEGDGEHVIDSSRVRVKVINSDVQLPDELAQWRDEIAAEQARRRESGEDWSWNGARYAVDDLVVSRDGPDEDPDVTLILKHSDYFSFLASQRLDRRFHDGSTLRSRYLDSTEPRDIPTFMRSAFGLYVAVVTTDGWLIVSRRARQLGVGAGQWCSTACEGLSRDKDSIDGAPPDLFQAAQRGVDEELGLKPDEYDLRMLALHVVMSNSHWGALFLARLSTMSRRDFSDHISRGIADGWEHPELDYVEFEPQPVLRYLLREDRRDDWAPAAPVLFYLSLVNAFGRRRTDQAAERVLHDL
jgi:hypothetical protein